MDLIIDLGNTNFKAATFDKKEIISLEIIPGNINARFSNSVSKVSYESAIISSVVPISKDFINQIKKISGRLLILDHHTKTPLKNKYKSPETLGPDRLALATGGYSLFPGQNVLVIDAGSCITYDLVSQEGEYCGGAISPGIDMRFKALNHFTGKLPLIAKNKIDFTTGLSTKDSILSGVVNGVIFEAEGYINHYTKESENLKVILSGGDSIFLADKLKYCTFAEPNLLLYGLQEILSFNQP